MRVYVEEDTVLLPPAPELLGVALDAGVKGQLHIDPVASPEETGRAGDSVHTMVVGSTVKYGDVLKSVSKYSVSVYVDSVVATLTGLAFDTFLV